MQCMKESSYKECFSETYTSKWPEITELSKMKYRQQLVSSSAPQSLQEWLSEQLKHLGIDGVYTRYIISLLLADTVDLTECEHHSSLDTISQQPSHLLENKFGDKPRYRRLKQWNYKKEEQNLFIHLCQQQGQFGVCCESCLCHLSSEQQRKWAAVECLKSASEQSGGIEMLIDEVYAKLKNLQADIETNPVLSFQAGYENINNSSPSQKPTALNYAAFPALSKENETLDKIWSQALQQNCEPAIGTSVWRKENGIATRKCHDILEDAEEKGNKTQDDTTNCSQFSASKEVSTGTSEILNKSHLLSSIVKSEAPLYIIPKMKVLASEMSDITALTPSTPPVIGQEEENASKKDFEKVGCEKNAHSGREVETCIEPYQPLKLIRSVNTAKENDLVTHLVSKFNGELAAIWEKGTSISKSYLDSSNLGFSLQISVQALNQDVPNFQFFVHSILPTVWSANVDDLKNFNTSEMSRPFLSPDEEIFDFLNQVVERNKYQSFLWSVQGDCLLDDEPSTSMIPEQICDELNPLDSEDEDPCFICPEVLFIDSTTTGTVDSTLNCFSTLEKTADRVTGIYNLWEPTSLQAPFPLEGDLLHLPLNSTSKVANWITHQQDVLNCNYSIAMDKNNKTLTYHKGESCFKEVVPLSKAKYEHFPRHNENAFLETDDNTSEFAPDLTQDLEENLLTSPKTHFKPIRQDSIDTDSQSDAVDSLEYLVCNHQNHSKHNEDQSQTSLLQCDVVNEELKNFNDFGRTRSASSSVDEIMLLTGHPEVDEIAKDEALKSNSFDFLQVMQPSTVKHVVFSEDKSTNTDLEYLLVDDKNKEANFLEFFPFNNDEIVSTDSKKRHSFDLVCPWKWSTSDDSEEDVWKVDEMTQNKTLLAENLLEAVLDCSLDAMRKELEKEEEELFRDINTLSDTMHFESCFGETVTQFREQDTQFREQDSVAANNVKTYHFEEKAISEMKHWEIESVLEQAAMFFDETKNEDEAPLGIASVPVEKILYSSELESEWQNSNLQCNFKVTEPKQIKSKTQVPQHQFKKPCSFFLEGNCRRSDCKFSHNLENITCRFWQEGTCFKGITCPFLHGYARDTDLCVSKIDEREFVLESEKDFPSLPALSSPVSVSKETSRETLVGRIIRPKKKKTGNILPV